MGKQKRKKSAPVHRPASTNSIDWEIQVRELVRRGLVSEMCLDRYPGNYVRRDDDPR